MLIEIHRPTFTRVSSSSDASKIFSGFRSRCDMSRSWRYCHRHYTLSHKL